MGNVQQSRTKLLYLGVLAGAQGVRGPLEFTNYLAGDLRHAHWTLGYHLLCSLNDNGVNIKVLVADQSLTSSHEMMHLLIRPHSKPTV